MIKEIFLGLVALGSSLGPLASAPVTPPGSLVTARCDMDPYYHIDVSVNAWRCRTFDYNPATGNLNQIQEGGEFSYFTTSARPNNLPRTCVDIVVTEYFDNMVDMGDLLVLTGQPVAGQYVWLAYISPDLIYKMTGGYTSFEASFEFDGDPVEDVGWGQTYIHGGGVTTYRTGTYNPTLGTFDPYRTPSRECYFMNTEADFGEKTFYQWPVGLSTNLEAGELSNWPIISVVVQANKAQYIAGYDTGYNKGLESGKSMMNVFTLLASPFAAMGGFLATEIFPGVTFGMVLAIPVLVSIIIIVVRLVRE